MLVLLHGFCEDSRLWDGILPDLHANRTYGLDLSGFGQAALPERPDMEAYARSLNDTLEAHGIDRCVLVGHSMGGYVALEFAARWPEKLAGLGLVHSHPFEDDEMRKAARLRGIETLRAGKRDLYVSQLFPGLFPPEFAEKQPHIVQQLIDMGKTQSPEAIVCALEAMLQRRDHQQTLRALHVPALFLLGEKDAIIPPEAGLRAAVLPRMAQIELLKGVGHMAMFEDSQETARILNNFWEFCAAQ